MSIARIFVIAVGLLGLAGCQDDSSFDIASQIGPYLKLPAPRQYLFPPMKIAQPGAGAVDRFQPLRRG